MIKKSIILLFILVIPAIIQAQNVKANAGNINDPKVLFISSAAMGLQNSAMVVAGYELYYPGIADIGLKNGFTAISFPTKKYGAFGVQAQYFTSGIYRQGNYGISYSYPILKNKLSLGLDLGLFHFSYNENNFNLVDANDPVFLKNVGKNSLDIGISIFANPISRLFWGTSLKHINKPNISLTDADVVLPIKIQSGLMFNHSIVSPLINVEYFDERLDIDVGLERWLFNNQAMLRANYNAHYLDAAAGFIIHTSHNWIRFDYEFRYPFSDLSTISNNFHQFMITYSFWQNKPDFEMEIHPIKRVIYAGEDAKYDISIRRLAGFEGQVQLSMFEPDTNIYLSFIPEVIDDKNKSHLRLTTSKYFKPGEYSYKVKAFSQRLEKKCHIDFEIKAKPKISGEVFASVDTSIIKETTTLLSHDPLLPYIFFNENQSELSPDRYKILNPERNPLDKFLFFPENLLSISSKYENTLNVIAKRLRDNPQMQIKVVGYNSGWGEEKGNLALSKSRAQTVCDYLIKNCGVKSDQLIVDAQQLPPDPAKNTDPLGREENQRVEITCLLNSKPILEPITTETSEITTLDSVCIFQIENLLSEVALSNWKLFIVEEPNDTFKVFQGESLSDGQKITWDWKNETGMSVSVDKEYRYQLNLVDSLGQNFTTDWKSIHIKKVSEIKEQIKDKKIEKNRLILFKYDRAEMVSSSELLQKELETINQKLQDNTKATLLIQGHTDIIGQPDYNMNLSIRRAKSVAEYFRRRKISESRLKIEGFGITKPLMNNNLPEGRMINRRVEIYIIY